MDRDYRYWRDKAIRAKGAAEYHAAQGDAERAAVAEEAYKIAAREALARGARCFTNLEVY